MKAYKKVLLGVAVFCLVAGLGVPISVLLRGNPITSNVAVVPAADASVVAIGIPVLIKIPSIGVNATVESVALTADGSMDVPSHPFDAAWYNLGPRPGVTGSAVIDGHVDWMNGATAVFVDLHKLKPGDKITVQDDKGAVVSFVVRKSQNYDATANAVDVFTSNDGKAHLNLITCEGAWDNVSKSYSKRRVVFADKE